MNAAWTDGLKLAAFTDPPARGTNFLTDRFTAVPLGGDYWRGIPYPVGQIGDWFILSGDSPVGSLTSADKILTSTDRYFSFLIAGSEDSVSERVELQVRRGSPAESADLVRRYLEWAHVVGAAYDGDYLVISRSTGHSGEMLRQEVLELPDFLLGRTARIKIIDDSSNGHITVDHFQFTSDAPEPHRAPVWGFADYHTHPMAHMGFGALQGIRTLWGVPGGDYRDYVRDPKLVIRDIPHCVDNHFGGPSAEAMINTIEKRLDTETLWGQIKGLFTLKLTRHGRDGGPDFEDFPRFKTGAHQQMHITQIHRAWQGGLRLMTAIAVHNQGAEYLASPVIEGQIAPPSSEFDVLKAQVCGIRQLADLNSDWMEIVYDPDRARDVIRRGKLAIVLGVEIDRAGQLFGEGSDLAAEVQYLWDLGIRHVFPVHVINNRLGSPAIFEPAYNALNQFVNGGYFAVEEGCARPEDRGDCVRFRMLERQKEVTISRAIYIWPPWALKPFLRTRKEPSYTEFSGHVNKDGLTADGRTYILELMKRGMLVDFAHFSQHAVEDLYRVMGAQLVSRGHNNCARFGEDPDLPAPCFEEAYPLIASHAHLRALSIQNPNDTKTMGFLPSEYELSTRESDYLQRTGGLMGQFLTEDPISPPDGWNPPFKNDCAGSSKGFGYSYLYAIQQLKGAGVGIASDSAFIPLVSPRFGPHACWTNGHEIAGQNERRSQQDGVVYSGIPISKRVKPGHNIPLKPYAIDGVHYFDFNIDGFAHYGMLPDLLQDLKNLGMPAEDFAKLFSSAEKFLQAWGKAERVSGRGVPTTPFRPLALDCEQVCHGLCPMSPDAGAPKP